MKLVGDRFVGFGKQKTLVLRLRAALITAALTALAALMLPTAAEAQQTESTTVTDVQYNQKQVQRTDSVSDAQVSPQQRSDRKAGGANVTTKDGCVRAEAGDAVVEVGCDEQASDGGNGGGEDNGGGGEGGEEPAPEEPAPEETTGPDTEPQDDEKGPLAGGEAKGNDVLVPGDVINVLPDGTEVVGIDQITIQTENCELTGQGNDLTVTLNDQGVPFRIRDGDNVDIRLEQDGTLVADGKETLGDSFPAGNRENPNQVIVPIPVDPENDDFSEQPNDEFPIISSTGVGGEGCRVVGASDGPDDGSNDPQDDVVDEIDRDAPLPDTGGSEGPRVPPVLEAGLLAFSALLGLAGWRLAARARL